MLGVQANYKTVITTSGLVASGLTVAAQGWYTLSSQGWGYHEANVHGVLTLTLTLTLTLNPYYEANQHGVAWAFSKGQ